MAMTCDICDRIGERLRADHDEGEELPPEARKLVLRDEQPYSTDILQCPSCGAWFTSEYRCDNDIYSPIHVSELVRISADKARETIEWRKNRDREDRREYLRRLRKKLGHGVGELSEEEARVVDHLVRRSGHGGQNLPDLEKFCGLAPAAMGEVLARLESRKIIERVVSMPAAPRPEDDPRNFTMLYLNRRA
ncbi:MAG: hypothetical protein RDV41_15010 [Planctomycetota bacterium]|nr:hypothetical protein [Planctomycetota bacterium]